MTSVSLPQLLQQVTACRHCQAFLPLPPRPLLIVRPTARLLIVGQAPGIKAHQHGQTWQDASGKRLRQWLNLSCQQFYNDPKIGIMPMGFCYPGKAERGDKPPRPECAPKWHPALMQAMPQLKLILLIGQYAQRYYLGDRRSLSDRVRHYNDYLPRYWPLPHPSPRNNLWLRRHPWFEAEILPALRRQLALLLGDDH